MTLLELTDVRKGFGNGVTRVEVLRGVTVVIDVGETVAITGPSGSGKTTLLNIAGGLDVPDAGTVSFDGDELQGLCEADRVQFRRTSVGFVFQDHRLLPQCTALENVLVPAVALGRGAVSRQAAVTLLHRVGLGERLNHLPGMLSGGECQRVAVARALMNGPRLMLADEPTGALDRERSEELTALMLELGDEFGCAIVLVTHARHVAEQMSRRVELRDGFLVA